MNENWAKKYITRIEMVVLNVARLYITIIVILFIYENTSKIECKVKT